MPAAVFYAVRKSVAEMIMHGQHPGLIGLLGRKGTGVQCQDLIRVFPALPMINVWLSLCVSIGLLFERIFRAAVADVAIGLASVFSSEIA